MSPEQNLYAASMMIRIEDAVYPLSVTVTADIDDQKKILDKKIKNYLTVLADEKSTEKQIHDARRKIPSFDQTRAHNYYSAIAWLEGSSFDWYAEACGYDTEFVRRTCLLIQDCLTWKAARNLRPARWGQILNPTHPDCLGYKHKTDASQLHPEFLAP